MKDTNVTKLTKCVCVKFISIRNYLISMMAQSLNYKVPKCYIWNFKYKSVTCKNHSSMKRGGANSYFCPLAAFPSVLWHWWFSDIKSIRPVKSCWSYPKKFTLIQISSWCQLNNNRLVAAAALRASVCDNCLWEILKMSLANICRYSQLRWSLFIVCYMHSAVSAFLHAARCFGTANQQV